MREPIHLYEELPILLDVFVSRFLFLFLLGLHGDVDVHPQLLTVTQTEAKFNKKKGFSSITRATNQQGRTALLLFISQEKLDDGVGFKIDFIHVGVLVLHHLKNGHSCITARFLECVMHSGTTGRIIQPLLH